MLNTFLANVKTKNIALLGLIATSSLSFAQVVTYQNDLGSSELGAFGAIMGFIWIFFLLVWLIGLGSLILWIFMLIHAAKHDINNKTTWIILLCILGLPVSIIYFFTERKRFNKTHLVTITPITQTPAVVPMQQSQTTQTTNTIV